MEKLRSPYQEFLVRRHKLPSALIVGVQDDAKKSYTLQSTANSATPVECYVTVPEWVDINGDEKSIKIVLKLRARKEAVRLIPKEDQRAGDAHLGAAPVEEAQAASHEEEGANVSANTPVDLSGEGKVVEQSEQVLTSLLELGMGVEETERFW
jgi:DsbC/DsbD-like thiol-disulfide interchange protein